MQQVYLAGLGLRQLAAVLTELEERWAERVGRARYRNRDVLDQLADVSRPEIAHDAGRSNR